MAAEFFVWDRKGQKLTPEQISKQREIANALIRNGMDYSPISSWTQGAARVAQGILGGIESRQADEAERANLEAANRIAAVATSNAPQVPVATIPQAPQPTAVTPVTSAAIDMADNRMFDRFRDTRARS